MGNKEEEWAADVIWMSRMNGQVEIDRGMVVLEHIRRPSVEHAAEVWWSGEHAGSWSRSR